MYTKASVHSRTLDTDKYTKTKWPKYRDLCSSDISMLDTLD